MAPFCNLLLHLYVKTDNLSVLTGAIEFLPFDDSLSNDFLSTLFKLQSTSGVKDIVLNDPQLELHKICAQLGY